MPTGQFKAAVKILWIEKISNAKSNPCESKSRVDIMDWRINCAAHCMECGTVFVKDSAGVSDNPHVKTCLRCVLLSRTFVGGLIGLETTNKVIFQPDAAWL